MASSAGRPPRRGLFAVREPTDRPARPGPERSARAPSAGPRVAILSLREIRPVRDFGGLQEAEDALVEALGAGLYRVVLASPRFAQGTLANPAVRELLTTSRVARPYRIEHHQSHGEPCDVLLVLARDLRDASVLVGLPDWHRLGHQVMVHVEQVSDRELRRCAELVAHLRRRVDALFAGCEMPPLGHLQSERLGTIDVVPPLLDVLAFPARPDPALRSIDVFCPDAVPAGQHQLLLQWASRHGGSYQRDVGQLGAVTSPAQRRKIFTAMATRSRLFLANCRRYGPTRLGRRVGAGGHHEVGIRFYEAMAAGCALVGDLPLSSRQYGRYVAPAEPLRLRMDADRLPEDVLAALSEPEHSQELGARARATALRRNDVAHRWKAMAELVGLPPSPGIEARITRLAELAEYGEQPTDPPPGSDTDPPPDWFTESPPGWFTEPPPGDAPSDERTEPAPGERPDSAGPFDPRSGG